ncbi:hypothetical protein SAMN06265218_11938 [Fodinibius sediminis]|uniref:Uncharacterized protein n=1 Tax=Fodinibius sediminis TaxID=1214077 RepID=A0A521EVK2_9BACT|nr:hypothetical protein SAMN06265218_11938 [Fodinibius sediminis]
MWKSNSCPKGFSHYNILLFPNTFFVPACWPRLVRGLVTKNERIRIFFFALISNLNQLFFIYIPLLDGQKWCKNHRLNLLRRSESLAAEINEDVIFPIVPTILIALDHSLPLPLLSPFISSSQLPLPFHASPAKAGCWGKLDSPHFVLKKMCPHSRRFLTPLRFVRNDEDAGLMRVALQGRAFLPAPRIVISTGRERSSILKAKCSNCRRLSFLSPKMTLI